MNTRKEIGDLAFRLMELQAELSLLANVLWRLSNELAATSRELSLKFSADQAP